MSNYTVEERLEGCWRGLRRNSIFMSGGTLLFCIGMALGLMSKHPMVLAFIYAGVGGFPFLTAFFLGGFGAAFGGPLKADYEVVTVDGYGNRVSSDGGAQSMQTNFIMRIGMLALLFFISPLFVGIHVFVLSIKGIILHLRAKIKPPFIKSVFFIILINIAVYIGGFYLAFWVIAHV